MKSKNNEDVRKGMLRFSFYLVATVFIAVFSFYTYMKTSSVEVSKIIVKTQEYDEIQMRQLRVTESVDSMYHYVKLLNSDPKINNLLLHNVLSERRLKLIHETGSMNESDVRLHKKLISQMGQILGTKDSIRIAKRDEDIVKMDLDRCMQDNKRAIDEDRRRRTRESLPGARR